MLGAIMAKIITTVGTSIISNFVNGIEGKFDSSKSIKMELKNIEKKPYSYLTKLSDEIQKIKSELLPFLQKHKEDASAEINSINKIISTKLNEPSTVYLICTDSVESYLCAELIKESNLTNSEIEYNIIVIDDLQVFDFNKYKTGLVNLVTQLYNIVTKEKNGYRTIDTKVKTTFNITGGFKGVIPYLTLMGQLLKLPLYYIFENTEELIEIPQLPIQFDWAFTEKYYFALCYDRTEQEKDELKKIGFIGSDGSYTGLGFLFKVITEDNYQKSSKAVGYLVELKLYEYYTQLRSNSFPYVIHSDETLNPENQKLKGGETDLVLSKKSPKLENESIIFEVKSIFELRSSKIIVQLEKKLELLKIKNIKPSEFVFFFYSLSLDFNAFSNKNEFINKIKELENILNTKAPELKTTFQFLKINITEKYNENVLSDFLTKPIKSEDIKTINI
jgi:putative CRISPR-associated protein (TIGR02619 family)